MRNRNQKMMEGMLSEVEEILKNIATHNGPLGDVKYPELVQHDMEMCEKFLKAFNQSLDNLHSADAPEPEKTPEQVALIERAKEIEKEARVYEQTLSSTLGKMKKGKKAKSGQTDAGLQQQMKDRKKLFKTIGGDKKWIPM